MSFAIPSNTSFEEFCAKYASVGLSDAEIHEFYEDEIASAKFAEALGTLPCPEWCTEEPGHGYDTIVHEERLAGRYHAYQARPHAHAWVHQYEERRGDEVTYEPLGILVDDIDGDIDVSTALELAADLVMAAKILAEIQSAQVTA